MANKSVKKFIALLTGAALLTGCGSAPASPEVEKTVSDFEPTVVGVYEAEDAALTGLTTLSDAEGFSGTGYVASFDTDDCVCTFTIKVEEEGSYSLVFTSAGIGGYKENFVKVDGVSAGNLISEEGAFSDSEISGVYLTAGEHTVEITKYWGWTNLDKLTVKTSAGVSEEVYNVSSAPVNPKASKNAKKVKRYLAENYGKNVISGQVCDNGMNGPEYRYINNETGKYPAILGLDFMNYSGYAQENKASAISTEVAINYWENEGGIPTFCWHWFAPKKFHKDGQWYKTFYAENVNIDLEKIMNGQDEEGYELLMEDVDRIAEQIKKLSDKDVPILFRPLHEASGGWFWWGASGPEAYKKLYIAIYDKLTNEHKLNNILWVWNGQSDEWYPGDEYVDIIGMDIYEPGGDYSSRVNYFNKMLDCSENYNRIIGQSECGTLTDIELMERDGCLWSYFCTWCGEFTTDESYTSKEELKKIYNSEKVITLDELPDWSNY